MYEHTLTTCFKKGSQQSKVHTYHEEGYALWHLSNKMVGVTDTSYTEYSTSKSVKLTSDMWSTK